MCFLQAHILFSLFVLPAEVLTSCSMARAPLGEQWAHLGAELGDCAEHVAARRVAEALALRGGRHLLHDARRPDVRLRPVLAQHPEDHLRRARGACKPEIGWASRPMQYKGADTGYIEGYCTMW